MTYTEAMNLIDKIYTQEKSEIYARYSLAKDNDLVKHLINVYEVSNF